MAVAYPPRFRAMVAELVTQKWTDKKIASFVGVHRMTVYKWRKDQRPAPTNEDNEKFVKEMAAKHGFEEFDDDPDFGTITIME